jgi:predicted 2-oxoglutarate/Fe(II)-dependent dioxygenase YbiX
MDLQYTELYPKVDIYTGLLPDADRLYQTMKQSEADADGKYYLKKWDQWSVFGTYTQHKEESEDAETGQRYDEEKYLSDRVYEAYSAAISDYVARHQIQLPEGSTLMSSSFSKYDEQIDMMNNNLTMQYHTDFIISERDMPGNKFFITCTTYINDDYDGGDICFYIDGKFINHKPKAGDILIFPSTEPYYHGVKAITKGNKFFVRNFIVYPFNGTDQWLKNQRTYGAHRWGKMEQERVEYENARNMLYIIGDKVVPYEEAEADLRYNK